MADSDFKISITADASSAVAAAQATTAALDKTAAAVSRVANDAERYQAALEQMSQRGTEISKPLNPMADEWMAGVNERRAAIASEGLAGKEAMDGVAEATGKATMRKEELGKAIGALNRAFPGLGSVARAVLNPLTLTITGIALAFRYAQSEIDRFNGLMTEIDWGTYSRKAHEASIEVGAVRDAAKEAADATERLSDMFNAEQSAAEKLDSVRKRVELAQARGIQDPVQRAKAEYEIEGRYAQHELDRNEESRKFKIAQQEKKAKDLRDAEARMRGEMQGIEWARSSLPNSGDSATIAKTIEEAKDKQKVGAEERKRIEADIEKYKRGGLYNMDEAGNITGMHEFVDDQGSPIVRPFGYSAAEALWRRDQGVRAGIESARRNEVNWSGALPRAQAGEQRLALLRPALESVVSSREGIEGMLPTQRAVAGIASAGDRGAMRLESRERSQRAANSAGDEVEKLNKSLADAIEGNKAGVGEIIRQIEEWKQWQANALGRMKNAR